VERAAFDILAGNLKDRQEVSEEEAAEMYWHGPQYGFADRAAMLEAEFDGRCAYCGQKTGTRETEHLLPRSRFSFDSYFNSLPACSACNSQKGSGTGLEAGLRIHPDAFKAYAAYVDRQKPPHLFHTIKKGLLNLLSRDGFSREAEKHLGMLAANLLSTTNTQKAQRPLARYLAQNISEKSGRRPEVAYTAGRHTALYRSILLPDFNKQAAKEGGDTANHAVDAIVLGCALPSAPAFENRRWYARAEDINGWQERVRAACPSLRDGLPIVGPVEAIRFFEEPIGDGYFLIKLSAFGWNRKRGSGHKLDPVGMTEQGCPLKREPAAEVLSNLLSTERRAKQIQRIAHRSLRQRLESDPSRAAQTLVEWLQNTVRTGVAGGKMGNHPADRERARILEEFVSAPVGDFLTTDKAQRKLVPHTIGVLCLAGIAAGSCDVPRVDRNGQRFQYYMADPHWQSVYVCYREAHGDIDTAHPEILWVNQIWAVKRKDGKTPVAVAATSPLHGRPLGSRGSQKEFIHAWKTALDEYFRREKFAKFFRIAQGAVIEKMDGTYFQLRNFDDSKPWMRGSPFSEIRRVYSSPFRLLQQRQGG